MRVIGGVSRRDDRRLVGNRSHCGVKGGGEGLRMCGGRVAVEPLFC